MNTRSTVDASGDAAAARLSAALSAVRCAATLLVVGAANERDRGVGVAILSAVRTAREAASRLRAASPRHSTPRPSLN